MCNTLTNWKENIDKLLDFSHFEIKKPKNYFLRTDKTIFAPLFEAKE